MSEKNTPRPAQMVGPLPVAYDRGSSEPDGEHIIVVHPMPRPWLHVTFNVTAGADPTRIALAAAKFASQTCETDRRLRMSVDSKKSTANANELVLVFALGRWGKLQTEWLEEAKPKVRELASAFEGAELKSMEVVLEKRD